MAANAQVNSIIVEYVEGIEVVKAFNQSGASYEKFVRAVTSFRDFTLDWFRCTWKSCLLYTSFIRVRSHYRSFRGNALAYVFFSLGMIGSPLPIWIMRDSFLAQISQQGMPEAYVSTLAALTSPGMIVVLVGAPIVGAILGILLAKGMFRKHFEKAGIL